MTRSFVLPVLFLAAQWCAAAPPPFAFHSRLDLRAHNSIAVVSADFNGDGIADLAALGPSIQVYLGKGHRQFAPSTTIPLGFTVYQSIAVADFNGDGKQDLIVSSGNQSLIFFGNGDGTFGPGQPLANWGYPVVTADFNHDGKADLALAQGTQIEVLLGNGNGSFAAPLILTGSGACLTVGDFNHDGNQDLLGCAPISSASGINVFLGKGDGTFEPPKFTPAPYPLIFATAGDLNNDGNLDVAAAIVYQNGIPFTVQPVFLFYGNGDGTFQAAQNFPSDVGEVFSLGIADMNGDGLNDLVAAGAGPTFIDSDFGGGLVATYFNNGQGLVPAAAYPVTWNSGANDPAIGTMVVTDLDGDHSPDVVLNGALEPYLSILFNNGKGQLRDIAGAVVPGAPTQRIFGSPLPAVEGNFDGQSNGELAFVVNGSQLDIYVPTGNVRQPFKAGPVSPLNPPSGSSPYGVAAGDFDGDGIPDLAICFDNDLLTAPVMQVYLGNGDGTFRLGSQITVPMVGVDLIAADFNGDGKLDVASSSGFLALGNGDGTFQTPTVFYRISQLDSTFGVWLAAADFNGDGKLDIALQAPNDVINGNPLVILLGNGDGTFQPPAKYAMSIVLPVWATMADFNNDGHPDIAVLSQEHPQDMIAVFLGNADGTFQAPSYVNLPFTAWPISLTATDLNGDGKADLAMIDENANIVNLFAGNGDGTFARSVEFGGGLGMAWIGYGNYQGQTKKGYPDLVFISPSANTFGPSPNGTGAITMLLNEGWKK